MELTFVNDLGQSFVVEIDPNMELENVMALLEAESGIPPSEQSISHNGQELSSNPKATMKDLGVGENALLPIRRKVQVAGRTMEQDSEMMLLGETQPEMAQASQSNPARFAELLKQTQDKQRQAELAQQREIAQLNANPFDVDVQRKIEEAIRQQAVTENMEHALEYSPESFGRVTMLYIPVEVNGTPVKAFVDSGAQQTIMSPDCAEACSLMRLLDVRFAGIARGVGTARILGRVHSAQMKLGDLHLPCSFTIMEGKDVDLLLGLDMLKAHQACIDLEKGVLRIQNREVRFLSEHELPEKARMGAEAGEGDAAPSGSSSTGASTSGSSQPATSFPGGGNTLGSAPRSNPGVTPAAAPAPTIPAASRYQEKDIQLLMGLGATREAAIGMLDAAGGNVDVAASLMF